MKVFYDARYTRFPRHDGVSRYGAELLAELAKLRSDITIIISDDRQLANLPHGLPHVKLNTPTSLAEPLIARKLNKLGADVVFSPLQTMGSLGKHYKLILTIHDLIYYTYRTPPASFNPFVRLLWRLYHLSYLPERMILSHADTVTVVSETTKHDVEKHRLTRKPIIVATNAGPAVSTVFTPKAPEKSLVYMGSFLPYKNVDTLARAMSLLPGYTLYLLSNVTDDEKQHLLDLVDDPAQLVFENGASDERYHELLSSAHAFVTASKFEGFGIPLLEAQANNAPVVCSDIPIFHEVANSSALYFDPSSPEALAERITQLRDPDVRMAQITAGRTNVARYSWAKSARVLNDAIEALAPVSD